MHEFSIEGINCPESAVAEQDEIAHDRVEYRLHVRRRTRNNAQYLRGRCLLLQRLAQVGGALAQLVEEPRVLDGDDGLRGEILHQRDLSVGERADLLAVNSKYADQL